MLLYPFYFFASSFAISSNSSDDGFKSFNEGISIFYTMNKKKFFYRCLVFGTALWLFLRWLLFKADFLKLLILLTLDKSRLDSFRLDFEQVKNINRTPLGETGCLCNSYFLLTRSLGIQFFDSSPFPNTVS